jgi:phage protein D
MSAVTAAERHVSLYTVLVDGAAIEEQLANRIHEVRVLSYLRLPDMCTFSVTFPKSQSIDEHPFEIGTRLEIKLGAREELTTTSLFKGDIVSLDVDFGPGGAELLVRGFDPSHVLMRSRNVRTFQNQTSSDIVERIVREAGLTVATDPSGDAHTFVQQDNETDWDFIWRLAERIGFEFVVAEGSAHFLRPRPSGRLVELAWPTTLRSFRPRVSATQQVGQVTLSAEDPMTKQPIDVSVSTPQENAWIGLDRDTVQQAFPGAHVHIATEPVESHAEGQAIAQALLDRLANG